MIRRPPRSTLFPYRRSSDLNLRNALAFPLAASDKAGTAWLYYGTDPVRNSLGKDPCCESGGEQVATESLDNILNQAGGGRVDVIKMDAEGAEELVLRGATNLLTSKIGRASCRERV